MSKDFANLVFRILMLYIIYRLIAAGITNVWHWFLDLLTIIGVWIQTHIELILITLGVLAIILTILRITFRNKQSTTPTSIITIPSTPLTEEERQQASFDRWSQIQRTPTLNQTQKMKEIINEMLKSNRHRKEYHDSYSELLQRNGFGYVYFVKAPNGTTKIGLTNHDPFKRIYKIFGGVNTSYDVEVIHLIRTDQPKKTEKAFHKYFEKKRHVNPYDPNQKSEFFHLNQEDWTWIKKQLYPNAIGRTSR